MILDIVFVRHALSCTNVWANKMYGMHLFYKDPELTLAGISTSQDLSSVLIQKIKDLWGEEPYNIGSSSMIRAQQTAYHMLASVLEKPINIMAHICETGLSLDNQAYPIEKQRNILEEKSPGIGKLLDAGLDGRMSHTIWDKSNFNKFLTWAELNPEYFELGSDGHYRAVIFTHSHFLMRAFNMENLINNNNAIHAVIDTNNKSPLIYDTWLMNNINLSEICPNDCHISHCDAILKNLLLFFIVLISSIILLVVSRLFYLFIGRGKGRTNEKSKRE
jgi:hypothetical protein